MSLEGYADPVMNNGPRFHSNMPVSELAKRVTQAIETSDVSSTPPVAKTTGGATITKTRKVGLARRLNARSQNDRLPKGSKSGKDLFRPTKPHGYTLEGSDLDERESPSLGHAVGDKRRPRPSESSCSEKHPKEFSTPP